MAKRKLSEVEKKAIRGMVLSRPKPAVDVYDTRKETLSAIGHFFDDIFGVIAVVAVFSTMRDIANDFGSHSD